MFGLIALLAAAASQSAAAPPPLQPSGKWQLDYGETQCIALRLYAHPRGGRTFAIRSSPGGDTYEVMLMEPGRSGHYAQQHEGSLDFGGGPINAFLLRFSAPPANASINKFRLTSAQIGPARQATRVTMRAKNGLDETLVLTNMAAVLTGLDECTADLRRYWNHGDAAVGVVATEPKAIKDLLSIFRDEDYPAEALTKDQQGRVRLALLIDPSGRVAECYIAEPSGVAVIDAMGCQVVRERARFEPARDASGKPVRSMHTPPPIAWRMSED